MVFQIVKVIHNLKLNKHQMKIFMKEMINNNGHNPRENLVNILVKNVHKIHY